MKLASSPCVLCIFADETLVLVKKFTSNVSNVFSVVEIFSVKATNIRFCTISAFKFQRNCSPSLSSEKKRFTQLKMQQQPDQSVDKRAVLAGHLIKRWRLVFITQERIICDLNKKRKAWFWVQWSGDTGVAATRCWSRSCAVLSDCEEIAHIQGQRRSLNKTVGGAKSCLESNPIPTRDAQKAQTYLVSTRTQRPHRDPPELCLSVSWGGTGQ